MQLEDATAQLARELDRARRRLGWEGALRLAAPILLAAGAWAAFWLCGLPLKAPPVVQSLSALAASAGLLSLAFRAGRRWRRPTPADARARLAADSRLDPGALETLDDHPAKLDPLSVALWRREQARARLDAAGARAGPVRLDLAALDPRGVRYAVGLALVIGALLAGPQTPDRLARAFFPDPGPLVGDGPMEIEAWITPAPYTHAAPISLSDQIGARIATPPSVEATVRVTGPRGAPRLVFDGAHGRSEARFTRAADGAYEARLTIPSAGQLRVVRFITRARWSITPAPDTPPAAFFTVTPRIGRQDEVRFTWRARDDFGVRRLALRVRPIDPPNGLRHAAPIDTAIVTPAGDPREAEAPAELDLAAHPYAGMQVEARIVAFDALGQQGESAPVRFKLPEKVFLQPLARASIEIRRMILWERRPYAPRRMAPGGPALFYDFDPVFGRAALPIATDDQDPRLERAPAAIRRAGRFLDALTSGAEDGYFRDRAVFMGLRLSRAELSAAREIDETDLAADTLWRAALRAEYGGSGDAQTALDAARQALADALANGADDDRIRQLMQALRQATQQYLQARVQEAMRDGRQPQTQEDTEEQASLSQRDIQNLMDQVQQLSEQGRHEEAQALLQQLAGLLQNLDVRLSQAQSGDAQNQNGQNQDGQNGDQQQNGLSQSLDQLSQAMGEQRALNDDTQQQQQQQQNGQQPQGQQGQQPQGQQPQQGEGQGEQSGGGQGQLAQRQGDIRQGLNAARDAARRGGGENADGGALNEAEGAMRRAEAALNRGDYEDARAAQDDAMQSLRRGANQMAAAMRQSGADGDRAGAGERDPLGRQAAGVGAGDGDTRVPTQGERVRAREILDDIRQRAEDPNRPEAERDYLRRLLERFTGS